MRTSLARRVSAVLLICQLLSDWQDMYSCSTLKLLLLYIKVLLLLCSLLLYVDHCFIFCRFSCSCAPWILLVLNTCFLYFIFGVVICIFCKLQTRTTLKYSLINVHSPMSL